MPPPKLEMLVVRIPGKIKSFPVEQAAETLRLATEVAEELKKATDKCKTITQLGGNPARVIGLELTGIESIEKIGLTYESNGDIHIRNYTKQEFYDL